MNERGSVALEAAMTLPLVAIVLLGVLQVTGVVRDHLVAQDAASAALRAAVTTRATAPVTAAAAQAAAPRPTTTTVLPSTRAAGDIVRVEVRITGSVGPIGYVATGRATGRVEPGVDP